MPTIRVNRAAAASAVPLLAVVLAAVPAGPAMAATWSVVPTPNANSSANRFLGADALSTSYAWAVGSAETSTSTRQPIAARWNGTAWALVTTPSLGGDAVLESVDANTTGNAWAVGGAGTGPLAERWNGTSWSVVSTPTPAGATTARLRGVKVLATDSAWAVGQFSTSTNPTMRTLVTRWNGTAWSIVTSPNPDPTQNLLVAVDGVANDLWAVGNVGHDGYGGGTVAGLVLRWNGTAWTKATIPSGNGFTITELRDVVAVASNDVWAVGTAFSWQTFSFVPYLLHWNGQSWTQSTIPNPPGGGFRTVTALSATKVYAFGAKDTGQPLIAKWNGSTWSQETPPAGTGHFLEAACAVAGTGTVWAVGSQTSSTARTLAIRTTNG